MIAQPGQNEPIKHGYGAILYQYIGVDHHFAAPIGSLLNEINIFMMMFHAVLPVFVL